MKLNEPADIAALMLRVDAMLEAVGVPSYSTLWMTNESMRADVARMEDRLGMTNLALSKAQGDLVQLDLIVRTATSVSQIGRQFGRMKEERARLEDLELERFDRRWNRTASPGE